MQLLSEERSWSTHISQQSLFEGGGALLAHSIALHSHSKGPDKANEPLHEG